MPDDQLGLFAGATAAPVDGWDVLGPARSPEQIADSAIAAAPTRRPQLRDVDARRECPVCRAAAHAPCYQHCEANRPG